MTYNISRIVKQILAAGIPLAGIDVNGNAQYSETLTGPQQTEADGIIAANNNVTDPQNYIDVTVLGPHLIGIINGATARFLPFRIRAICVLGTSVSSVASLSIGTNSPNYDNIIAITAMTGLNATNKMVNVAPFVATTVVNTNIAVYAKVTTAAVATACKLRIDLIGDYEPKNGF